MSTFTTPDGRTVTWEVVPDELRTKDHPGPCAPLLEGRILIIEPDKPGDVATLYSHMAARHRRRMTRKSVGDGKFRVELLDEVSGN